MTNVVYERLGITYPILQGLPERLRAARGEEGWKVL